MIDESGSLNSDYNSLFDVFERIRGESNKVAALPMPTLFACIGASLVVGWVVGGIFWVLFFASLFAGIYKLGDEYLLKPLRQKQFLDHYDKIVERMDRLSFVSLDPETRVQLTESLLHSIGNGQSEQLLLPPQGSEKEE